MCRRASVSLVPRQGVPITFGHVIGRHQRDNDQHQTIILNEITRPLVKPSRRLRCDAGRPPQLFSVTHDCFPICYVAFRYYCNNGRIEKVIFRDKVIGIKPD